MPNELRAARNVDRSWRKLVHHITCCHCWHRFPCYDLAWVSRHEELRGDPVLGPSEPIRFMPTRFNVACEAIDGRGLACQQFACPRCHLPIPRVFLEGNALIFSLIGVPSSGKTYFLTAMTWELRHLMPARLGLAFSDVDVVNNQILNGYEETLFLHHDPEQPVALEKTQLQGSHYDQVRLEDQNVLLPRPFLFTIRPTGKHALAGGGEDLSRILCLYDNAGEHFLPGTDTTLEPGSQHLAHSRVLMFLYDPTQDTRFREACRPFSQDQQLYGHARTQLQSTILTEAALRVRLHAGLPPNRKLAKPLLVLVSKSDVWGRLMDEDLSGEPYLNGKDSSGLAKLDSARIRRVSAKVRELLLRLTPEFVPAAEDFCQHVVYIPVSALGRSPEVQESSNSADGKKSLAIRPRYIRPAWVTVPITYAFARWSTEGFVAGET